MRHRLPRVFSLIALLFAAPLWIHAEDRPVDFDRDIAPILSTHCLRCHGTLAPEAGLDLTDAGKAKSLLKSGVHAISPGEPDSSELLHRLNEPAIDSGRMPPVGEPLDTTQIELIRRWIGEGAEWPGHWAYRALEDSPPPSVIDSGVPEWSAHPVDRFIQKRVIENGLQPSPPADRRTWLRRVTFDLTGLPPTPAELAEFEVDASPKAKTRVVDRLLASPHYGERWARHWMDLARFAETHGHDQDRPRPNAWPYRDYLVRAFNEDTPFDRFVEEQIAGDVLDPGNPHAIVATGFLAAGPWDESSLRDIREDSIDRQIARVMDRDEIVTAVMTAFASSTAHCARCHDHKFDPITQSQYYSLQAVFAGVDKAERAYDPDPAIAKRRLELTQHIKELASPEGPPDPGLLTPALQGEVASWERDIKNASDSWIVLDPMSFDSSGGATLTELPDHSILSGGTRPETDIMTVTAPLPVANVTALRIEVLTDDSLPLTGPGRQDNGNLHLNELKVSLADCSDAASTRPLEVANLRSDFDQESWTAAMAIDGNPATAWGIYPEISKPHHAVFEFREQVTTGDVSSLVVRLEQTHGGGHLIGRVRLAITSSPAPLSLDDRSFPADIASLLAIPSAERNDAQRRTVAAFYVRQKLEQELAALPPQQKVYVGTNQFTPDGSFKPADEPRAVHVLHRGEIKEPRDVAAPAALSFIEGLDAELALSDMQDEGARRAAFAHWLSDDRNVLVWRSIVNRVWQSHFGEGLVASPNDFGRMGSTPSHRELLDWLTLELLHSGGSLKHLHRLIVTSATYGQASSHHEQAAEVDASNRLLWRMNRTRLDAEQVRDAALVFSGELDCEMGGPSVKQFIESPGIHVTPNVDYRAFDPDAAGNRRRGVYRFLFRTLPDPFMETLDCPDGSRPTGERTESVTALQAFAMLNDPFIVRRSEHLAERLKEEKGDLASQISRLYELVLLRSPSENESNAFVEYAKQHGLANACRMLLNSNEFLFVD